MSFIRTIWLLTLIAFLYPENPKTDDAIAEDFIDDPAVWHSKRPPLSELLKTVHPRVRKEVAHLTYARARITSEQRQWPFVRIAVEIVKA